MKLYFFLIRPLAFALFLTVFVTSCTENQIAKKFGGTSTVNLPKGRKLITSTWKDEDLWYSTRQMKQDEEPETIIFEEKSNFGVIEGKVIFVETK